MFDLCNFGSDLFPVKFKSHSFFERNMQLDAVLNDSYGNGAQVILL